jgi:hypothetical protein
VPWFTVGKELRILVSGSDVPEGLDEDDDEED